jgi:polyphosphate kinase
LEQIIIANLGELFGGMEIVAAHAFRVTRNADVARNEEEAEDLLEMITDEVGSRLFFSVFLFVLYLVACSLSFSVLPFVL